MTNQSREMKINVVVKSRSSSSFRCWIQGLLHSFINTLGSHMDVAITLLMMGNDIVHIEQIRGVCEMAMINTIFKIFCVLFNDVMMGVFF